ncbi:L-cysteine desulfhydrase [Caldalkalibacillus thermarum]|uniref:tryptophanase n=1 Tax=Caldalkalibacillus thermarum TaxID=296745 RepID=UPI001665E1A9|nr:tryptophanase [Caldalkalibacillus thermarum]GGK32361.1 L-cysteine desulfhydrase [Caldalkalibacillus thermarum]
MYQAEPFRIKMVEPIRLLPREVRIQKMEEAGYNPFALQSADVFIDLLTDSGTGAMSDRQWAALMRGDEAYAGSRSYQHLKEVSQQLFGHRYILPVHQGRGAEQVLFPLLINEAKPLVLGNMHFDTTRAHIQLAGGEGIDLVIEEAYQSANPHPFKGNIDLTQLSAYLEKEGDRVAMIIMTVTCNGAGGQPVSMANLKEAYQLARKYHVPLILDAARFAENAYFIRQREEGYTHKTIAEIVREMFRYCDGFTMSAKKDGLVNIGGLLGIKENEEWALECQARLVAYEGFPTYGGLAGRDMEALAVGLTEVIEPEYLEQRIGQVRRLGEDLIKRGIPIQQPVGGHALFVDAGQVYPHIPKDQFPAQVLAFQLYMAAGVRGVEIGSLLYGRHPQTGADGCSPVEFLRLAIPRRTYTDNHMRVVAEGLSAVMEEAGQHKGLQLEYEAPILRHFTARLKPVSL